MFLLISVICSATAVPVAIFLATLWTALVVFDCLILTAVPAMFFVFLDLFLDSYLCSACSTRRTAHAAPAAGFPTAAPSVRLSRPLPRR